MASEQTLRAVITATNETGPVFAHISEELEKLTRQARMTNAHFAAAFAPIAKIRGQVKELGEATGIVAIGEHAKEAGEHFRRLHEHVTDFLKPLGALTALASVGGIAEAIKSASEYGEHLELMSAATGVGGQKLAGLEYAAKLANIPQEQIDRALQYQNRQISEAARGKDKDVEAIIAKLGIANTPGHIASTEAVLRAAEDASQKLIASGQVQLASDMLSKLYGERQGAQLLPLFAQGSGHIGELQAEAVAHGLAPSQEWIENAAKFQEQYKQLDSSVIGLSLSISGHLFPVLTPIIEDMSKWIDANREWIATNLADAVKELADDLRQIDWRAVGEDVKIVAADARWLVQELGGLPRVLEIIAGLKVAGLGLAFLKIGTDVVKTAATIAMFGRTAPAALNETEAAARRLDGTLRGMNVGQFRLIVSAFTALEAAETASKASKADLTPGSPENAKKQKDFWNEWFGWTGLKDNPQLPSIPHLFHKMFPSGAAAPAPYAATPAERAFLGSLAKGESRSYTDLWHRGTISKAQWDAIPKDKYGFPLWAGFPVAPGSSLLSHAAGRYQFEPHTWEVEAKKLGLHDMSQRSQDSAAWDLAATTYRRRTGRDLGKDLAAGRINDIASVLHDQWTSLGPRFTRDLGNTLARPIRTASAGRSQKGKIDVNVRVDHRNPPPGATLGADVAGSGDYEFGDLGRAFAG